MARVAVAAVLAAPAAMQAACGGSGADPIAPIITVDTTTLAGRWTGFVDGTVYGYSTITTILNADSTMSGEASNPLYCKVVGTWTVASGKYTSTGRDCDGILVTWTAPFNKVRLVGTWTASSGKVGTFNIGKE
jgi:polygalacturonase